MEIFHLPLDDSKGIKEACWSKKFKELNQENLKLLKARNAVQIFVQLREEILITLMKLQTQENHS